MAAIFQMKFSNGFSWNENVWMPIKISLKFVPRGSNEQYSSIGSDNGLVPVKQQAIIWNNDGLVYWRKYAMR